VLESAWRVNFGMLWMQASRVSLVVACFEHNRRHKEKGGSPEIPMSRVYFLKNN
jgi:hypothetical protein